METQLEDFVKRIVEAHAGEFKIESAAMGTIATVQLPLALEVSPQV